MVHLDYRDTKPIYTQIVENFRSQIATGILQPGDKLPSVRELAAQLSINPNTIQRAYTELERRGVIYTVKGKGNFVADMQPLLALREKEVKEEAEHLVRKAKEAGMTKEVFVSLLDTLWQDNKTASKAVGDTAGVSEPEIRDAVQNDASPKGVGGEEDD